VYVVLIAGLLHVLHLLRIDVSGMAHSRALKLAIDAGSGLLCMLWIFSARGRLKALGRCAGRWSFVRLCLSLACCCSRSELSVSRTRLYCLSFCKFQPS